MFEAANSLIYQGAHVAFKVVCIPVSYKVVIGRQVAGNAALLKKLLELHLQHISKVYFFLEACCRTSLNQ